MWLLKTALVVSLVARAFGSDIVPANDGLVAHEWGTFTSVAGEDGSAVQWAPLSGTPDLPSFVKHLSPRNLKLG
jgi:hypothetical protein